VVDEPIKRGSLSGGVKTGVALGALAGIGLGTALILYFGLEQVGDAFLTAGWRGLAAMTGVGLAPADYRPTSERDTYIALGAPIAR
jgi:hypothetical protein